MPSLTPDISIMPEEKRLVAAGAAGDAGIAATAGAGAIGAGADGVGTAGVGTAGACAAATVGACAGAVGVSPAAAADAPERAGTT
jgi:hypothetical protein